jgi:hypothetical protein
LNWLATRLIDRSLSVTERVATVQNQPTDPELPDEQAPDQDLRAARVRIREVGSTLRQALAADEQLAGPTEETGR